jgi:hypothetical protein
MQRRAACARSVLAAADLRVLLLDFLDFLRVRVVCVAGLRRAGARLRFAIAISNFFQVGKWAADASVMRASTHPWQS